MKWSEDSVERNHVEKSKTDRNKMILSRQTLDEIKLTVYSTVELVPFLLENGMPKVHT